MVVAFGMLNRYLQLEIIEKMHLSQFEGFQKSSRKAFEIGNRGLKRNMMWVDVAFLCEIEGKIKFQFQSPDHATDLEGIPFRLHSDMLSLKTNLTDDFCDKAVEFLKTTKSQTDMLWLVESEEGQNCTSENLIRLLKVTRAVGLGFENAASVEYFSLPLVQSLNQLSFSSPITDDIFLKLQGSKLSAGETLITSAGVNIILKEWAQGNRPIEEYEIVTVNEFDPEEVFAGIKLDSMDVEMRVYDKTGGKCLIMRFASHRIYLVDPQTDVLEDDEEDMEIDS